MKLWGGLGRVLVALVPAWLAWTASQAVIGWLVYAATASPALVGLAFALRFAPLAIVGVPMGALSDRLGRVRILQGSCLLAGATAFAIAALAGSGAAHFLILLAAAAALGLADAGRMVAGNNLVFDLAGDLGTTRAMAVSNFVSGIGAALGGGLAGVTLGAAGPAFTATVVGAAYMASAVLLIGVSDVMVERPKAVPSFVAAIGAGLALLRDVPTVGVLIGVALAAELFAFSSIALDPVFAGQVFAAGPAGLGLILVGRAIGRLAGSGMLALMPPHRSLGRVLTLGVLGFGVALVAYSLAPRLVVAVPIIVLVGIASVVVDALVLTALQAGVDAGSRGRVAGLWVLIIGLQPLGVLEVGTLAQFAGARFAQLFNGVIVVAFGLLLVGTTLGRRIRDIEAVNIGAQL